MTRIQGVVTSEASVQELFEEVRARAVREAVSTFSEYRDLVEDLIQEKMNEGMYDSDEDLPTMQKDLEMMWPTVEAGLR